MNSLLNVFKGSKVIEVLLNIVKAFEISYENSRLKINLGKISNIYCQSVFYKKIQSYANKRPFYRNSFIYKIIMFFVGLIDRFCGFLNKFLGAILSGSIIKKGVEKFFKSGCEDKLFVLGVFSTSLSIGNFLAIIFLNISSIFSLIVALFMLVLGVVLIILSFVNLEDSKFVLVFRKFIELIR